LGPHAAGPGAGEPLAVFCLNVCANTGISATVRQNRGRTGMILSCGEALIDMLPRTSTEGEGCFAPYAGGAVFNTAIALGRLGAPSAFFSGVSTDMLGEILADTLTASQVDTRYLAR